MSDDREEPKPGAGRGGVIPAAVEPFLRKRSRPRTQKLGEDPDLDAAVAAFKALGAKPAASEEPPVQDLSVGMGNASAYVAPTELKPARVPGVDDGPRVELGMVDVPRALPEGSRSRDTEEMKVVRLPPRGGEDEPTVRRDGRTVGGGTARLPVVKADSPWSKDAAGAPVAPVELPSAHAPSRGAASEPPTTARRGRGKGVVVAGTLFGVAVFVVLRVATTRTDGAQERTTAASGVATTTAGPPSAAGTTAPTAAAPLAPTSPSAAVQPTGTAPRPDTPAASTGSPTVAPPATSGGRLPPGKRRSTDEPPPMAATPSPVVTVAPVAPPPPTPSPLPSPITPPPQPTAAPKAPATVTPFDKPNYD